MIRLRHFLLSPAVALAALFLGGCIDSREEVWIERDGSGRAELRVDLPTVATRLHGGAPGVRRSIESFLAGTPEIEPEFLDVATRGDRTEIRLAIRFASALAISNATSGREIDKLPSAARSLAGTARARTRGWTLDFSRTISPGDAIPGAAWLPGSQLAGRSLQYIVHLPAAAKTSNATRVENGGRTLVWDVPLAEAVKDPLTTRFEMDLPVPWGKVTAVAIPLSLAGGWFLLRRGRKPVALPGRDT